MKQTLINEEERKLVLIGNEGNKGLQLQIEYDDTDAYIDLNEEEVKTLIWALQNEL